MKQAKQSQDALSNYFLRNFLATLKPPRKYSVSEWADEHRILSRKASAEAGKWRTSRTPYLKEIMDTLSADDPTEEIVFMKGSQVGGTECGNNWLGYIIDHSPAPTMAVLPTLQSARKNSKHRFDPLIEECPRLRDKVSEKKTADAGNTLLEKSFENGILILTGANSATGLKSTPARFMFFDEVDEYPPDVDAQGDAIDLGKARAKTFSKKKFFEVSTPTVEGFSRIAELFENSDQRYYYVPCPECGHFQRLEWGQIRWDKDETGQPVNVHYCCISCEYEIQNWQKTEILKRGRWEPKKPGHRGGKVAGFHLSSLYSPVGWYSWEQCVEEFLLAKGNPDRLKAWVNGALGETWKEQTERPDWHRLYERRELYLKNIIPEPVGFLTCGVDVQRDRLELEIVGWAEDKITYSIDYRVLPGDTSQPAVWNELAKVLGETWPREENPNIRLSLKMMAIDCGYETQMVYNWCRKYPGNRVVPVKGTDNLNTIIGLPKAVNVTMKGRTIKRGTKYWPVGVNIIKAELYGWLRQNAATESTDEPYGFCHFPEYPEDYFKMLTAEECRAKFVKGKKTVEWIKANNERNEALDCRVYNRAAAAICGIDRFTSENWRALRAEILPPVGSKPVTNRNKKERRKRKGSIW